MSKSPRIYVAGHRGMVGSAIVRVLRQQAGVDVLTRTRQELDLTNQAAVRAFFAAESQTKFTWLRPKLAVSMPITLTRQSSFTKI